MYRSKAVSKILMLLVIIAFCSANALTVKPAYAATIIVTTQKDSGAGSLRNAIQTASSGDKIVFASTLSGATIMLTSGTLIIDKNLVIDGSNLWIPITISGGYSVGVFSIEAGPTVTLDSLRIIMGNRPQGGGINNSGILTIKHCTIDDNQAVSHGGGIANFATVTVINSTLSNNTTTNTDFYLNRFGGGIFNAGTLNVTNSTISANSAFLGGGIYNSSNKTVTITNSTISGNTWDGIFNAQSGTLNYINTIVANSSLDCKNDGTIGLNVHNLVVNNSGCGTPHITQNPMLDDLDYYGGLTKTHALLPNSPAIDAGSNAYCPPTDQRGAFRSFDGNDDGNRVCDIGAYEYGSYQLFYTFLPLILK